MGILALTIALALLLSGCATKPPSGWEALPLGTDASFDDVWFADSLNGWIVGGSYQLDGGLVGRTRDGGVTWEYASGLFGREPRLGVEAVWFLDAQRGFVTTAGGMIYGTQDGGGNWTLARYGRGSGDHLFDFDFIDERTGWAAGQSGVIGTIDGGATWEPAAKGALSETRIDAYAVDFLDARSGWIVGPYGTLMKTQDGGATWTEAATPLGTKDQPSLRDVHFPDPENGWVVGAEGTILHTADGGDTWARQETGVEGARSVPKPEMIQRRAGVIDTIDTGQRTPGLFLTAVHFLDSRRGWVVGHFGYEGRSIVLRTENGGATWRVEAEAKGEELRALFVLDESHAWAIGDRVRPGPQTMLRYRGSGGGRR